MSKENHSVAKSSQQPCLASPTTDPLTVEQRYQRAQSILQGLRTQNLVQNDRLLPHWITGTCCFWYQRHKKLGPPGSQLETEFRLVNTQDLSSKPAFDHRALAESLGRQVGQLLDANSLPIEILSVSVSPLCIRFTAFDQQWQFNGATRDCETMTPQLDALPNSDTQLSPNGKTLAFVREGNIGLKILATGAEYPLTHDGQDGFAYAKKITASGIEMAGVDLQWSPDSRRILTSQRDTRGVRTCPMVDYNPTPEASRATVTAVKVALPGDRDIERHYLLSIDTVTGETTQIDWPGLVAGAEDFGFFTTSRRAWWASDSRRAFCVVFTAVDYQCVQLLELDTHTGAARIVFEEPSAPYINLQADYLNPPLHCFLPDSDELIWWSERSGWGHLYRYDLITGECLGAITQGEWQVRNLLQVDCARRELLIQTAGRTAGRNPYYRDLCRVNIDSGALTTLVSSDHDYCVYRQDGADGENAGASSAGDAMVVTRSRADQVPVSLLLSREGDELMVLETADVVHLPDQWVWPQPLSLDASGCDAAGAAVKLYGTLFRPSHFCETQQYPVINMIVGGPWLCATPHGSFHNSRGYADRHYFQAAALAELGFMVVIMDSRGTPMRHKAFQTTNYGWIPEGTQADDFRFGLEQLAQRYPQMDLDRVGIYSPTGYPGGIDNLMANPDFYGVGVVSNLMDTRLMSRTGEHVDKYEGAAPKCDKLYPDERAAQWNGKLLLIQMMSGWASSAYSPAGAMRLIDALQQANKPIDMIVRSNDKASFLMTPYEQRRAWDYFVRHLQGAEPPHEFELGEFHQ